MRSCTLREMSARWRLLFDSCALILSFALVTSGCAATRQMDLGAKAGTEPDPMLNDTAVGEHRCEEEGSTSSPFVVEWDATDLSTFEAKAARDVIFVKYEACKLELLYSCADNGVPGRYGRYDAPTFTSGTVESFVMDDKDELYAKLPLGAARFGTKVTLGQSLELSYFVSGVVNGTRNYVNRSDLSSNPRCAGATHFVSAYNLGAFRLMSHKSAEGEAQGGNPVVEAGAKSSQKSENLKEGGSLDDCQSASQRRCRVPIRLVLERISETDANSDADVVAASAAQGSAVPPPTDVPQSADQRAWELRRSAKEKEEIGDGTGCLVDLDRAKAIGTPNEQAKTEDMMYRSYCLMRAGKCEEGRALQTEFQAYLDKDKQRTDEEHAAMSDRYAEAKCTIKSLRTSQEKMVRLAHGVDDARDDRKPDQCLAWFKEGEALHSSLPKNDPVRAQVGGQMTIAALCLGDAKRCDEAKALLHKSIVAQGHPADSEMHKHIYTSWSRDLKQCE